MFYLIDLVK